MIFDTSSISSAPSTVWLELILLGSGGASLSAAKRLVEVGPEFVGVLDTDAESEQRRRQVLLAGDAGSPFDRRLHRSEAGRVLNQLDTRADGVGFGRAAAHVEGDDRAKPAKLTSRDCVGRMRGESRISRERNTGV